DGGRRAWVRRVLSPVRDPGGRTVGVLGILWDVTEQRRLEAHVSQASKMDALGQLAGGIAHDFNNLLTAIQGYTDVLLMDFPPGPDEHPARKGLEEIQNVCHRAAELTNQLLAFSRKQVLDPRVLDLNSVIASTDRLLRRLLGEDIDITTEFAPGLGPVRADPGRIEQVLVNLAVNARDAMPEGGRLTITTADVHLAGADALRYAAEPGAYVKLSVADTGHGMDAETQARVFEPFFTTKEAGKGTGLGLSNVYGIVRQSGGFVRVRSEPGRGTEFEVYLPRAERAADAASPATSGAPQASRAGTETILLLEDEPAVREVMRRILLRAGYTVLEARGVEEARRVAGDPSTRIDLLVSDVVMPGMKGPSVARELLGMRPGMKVIFISGYADEERMERGWLEPDTPFLQKPFTPATLLDAVRKLLDRGERPPGS
ncbi:MAG: response regulator, partial [Gemmatimonadetes bacterium]|nr:response regulator [Gemmatimonadota bacterium]